MNVLSLTHESEQILGLLLAHGGCDTLLLCSETSSAHAKVCVEAAPPQLDANVVMRNTTNSIKLQATDAANAQHLADFIEAIANGTLDTAETTSQPTVKDCLTVEPDHIADAGNMVNHPPHYTQHPSGVECIEVAEHLPFCLGNAFKYLFRRDHKNTQRQDLEKALWYINRQRDLDIGTNNQITLDEEASDALRLICSYEPVPYRHIMEMVGSGRMLDLAAQMLADLLDQH